MQVEAWVRTDKKDSLMQHLDSTPTVNVGNSYIYNRVH